MNQSLFLMDENDGNIHVIITQVEGNLNAHTWQERHLMVEVEGSVAELKQEGSIVTITDSKGDLAVKMPTVKSNGFITAISVTQLSGDVTIKGVEQATLKDIGGDVTLKDITGNTDLERIHGTSRLANIGGNVHAVDLPTLLVRGGITGDADLSQLTEIEIDFVGGNVTLDTVSTAEIIAISGDLEARDIEIVLHCTTVGGDCLVVDSPNAEIAISNVANDFQMQGRVPGRLCNIGGNLNLQATYPADKITRFHVEGDATVTLPVDTNLMVQTLVGGDISGEARGSYGGGSSLNLLYGNGAATLYLNIGGDLTLLGKAVPHRP